ncbi:MAG: trypsin-like peptidase domain-containing protein [Candidatus Bathyarchaeia archaeon]
MRNSIVFAVFLSLLALASISLPLMVKVCEAAPEEYSSAMIAELGEAATVLIYTQISATIKIYIPDVNWVPTTEYFLVPVGIAALGSGFFVTADGYIVTAGHVLFCFTHQDLTQDLYTKYFLIEGAFTTIIEELESEGYYLTPEEQAALWNYVMSYGEIKDSLRRVYAVLGEVAPTLTDVQSKGWIAREIAISPFFERDVAIIKIEPPSNYCPVLMVGDSDAVMTGESVYSFGFADVTVFAEELGVETLLAPSMKEGIISQRRLTSSQTPCFETSASLTHGMSGGPGLSKKGEVIGICSMGSVREGVEVAGFNYLIASNVVKSMMNEANIANKNVQGPVDEAFIQGLKYYYARHYSAAKQKFEACTGLFDYHWRAKALIKSCNSAIARGDDVPLPSVSLTTPTTSLALGESVTFTASVSGGNLPITYKWYLNNEEVSSGTSNSWKFTPTSEGTYLIYVVAVDADGCTAQSQTATLTVTPAPGLGGTWIILIILVAAAIAVIALFLAQKRRIRSAPAPII